MAREMGGAAPREWMVRELVAALHAASTHNDLLLASQQPSEDALRERAEIVAGALGGEPASAEEEQP